MKFNILTLFPEMYKPLEESIIKRAREKSLIEIELINIRDFSENKHNKVDDTPYGGGPGMVMKADVLKRALDRVLKKETKKQKLKVIYLSPKGKILNQEKVKKLSKEESLILIAGHYEGIDQRFIDKYVDEEISIGDYILTGGELPSMILVDSISRMVKGVLSEGSLENETFENYLLEYPQYTRPLVFEDVEVPNVLVSGNHKEIEKFRRKAALKETYIKRKDLIKKAKTNNLLTKDDEKYLEELKKEKEDK